MIFVIHNSSFPFSCGSLCLRRLLALQKPATACSISWAWSLWLELGVDDFPRQLTARSALRLASSFDRRRRGGIDLLHGPLVLPPGRLRGAFSTILPANLFGVATAAIEDGADPRPGQPPSFCW